MRRAILIALCWLAGAANCARADSHSVSYSTWTISGSTVTLKFLLPLEEARALTGSEVPVLTVRKVGTYILEHVSVRGTGGDCPAIDQGYDLGKVDPLSVGSDLYGFEIVFRCTNPGGLVIRNSVLFEQVPEHVNFARIQSRDAAVQQLFTAGSQSLSIPDSAAPQPATLGAWIRLGVLHVILSPDRLCFLLGLVLLAGGASVQGTRGAWATAYAALGLLAGYGISLAVSATGWIDARMTMIEAFIGFGVMLFAVTTTTSGLDRSRVAAIGCSGLLAALAIVTMVAGLATQALVLFGAALLAGGFLAGGFFAGGFPAAPLHGARRMGWLLPAMMFGFLDGFELPSRLIPLQPPPPTQWWMVTGFDTGAELTAAAVLAALAGGSMLMSRWNWPRARRLVRELTAASLGGLGTFWLLSRLYA